MWHMWDLNSLGRKPKGGLQPRRLSARSVRSTSIWLMLKQIEPSGTCIRPLILKRPATFTFMAVIGKAAGRGNFFVLVGGDSRPGGGRGCPGEPWALPRGLRET